MGPCKVSKNFGSNTYELEVPDDLGINTVFKVEDQSHVALH